MTNLRPALAATLAAATLLFSPVSQAQMSGQNWYAGAGIGQSKAKDACTGAAALGVACDDTDTATKIFGGYQFNKNFAVEVGYADLGKATASVPGVSGEWKATTWDILAVGILPINQQFSVLGKIGMASWSLDASLTALGVGSATQSASGTDVTYAVGVQYDFNDKVGLRAEWQTYSNVGDENTTGQSDVSVIGASVLFRF